MNAELSGFASGGGLRAYERAARALEDRAVEQAGTAAPGSVHMRYARLWVVEWGTGIGLWSFGTMAGFSQFCSSSLEAAASPLAASKSQSLTASRPCSLLL